jgi:hypothetical protein
MRPNLVAKEVRFPKPVEMHPVGIRTDGRTVRHKNPQVILRVLHFLVAEVLRLPLQGNANHAADFL